MGDFRTADLSINSTFLNQTSIQNKIQMKNIMSFDFYGKPISTYEVNYLEIL